MESREALADDGDKGHSGENAGGAGDMSVWIADMLTFKLVNQGIHAEQLKSDLNFRPHWRHRGRSGGRGTGGHGAAGEY